jgi:hypothetical protein
MLTNFLKTALHHIRDDIRTSPQGVDISIVTRVLSGSGDDFYNRKTKITETVTTVRATGGLATGYVYDETAGGVVENSDVRFELSRDYATTLRTPSTIIRFSSEDYAIDSVNDLPDTDEVVISCSRIVS